MWISGWVWGDVLYNGAVEYSFYAGLSSQDMTISVVLCVCVFFSCLFNRVCIVHVGRDFQHVKKSSRILKRTAVVVFLESWKVANFNDSQD